MTPLKFTEKDFPLNPFHSITSEYIADLANARLAEMLREAKVVYGSPNPLVWSTEMVHGNTHKALLIGIEELKRECVEHEPIVHVVEYSAYEKLREELDEYKFIIERLNKFLMPGEVDSIESAKLVAKENERLAKERVLHCEQCRGHE